MISSEENREPPLNGRTGGSSHGDKERDRNKPPDNKGFVNWLIGKCQSAWKRPYWSNLWHTSQWDWRHGTTALFGAAGTAALLYGGYYYTGRIGRAIDKLNVSKNTLNAECSRCSLIDQPLTDTININVWTINDLDSVSEKAQNLKGTVKKYLYLLPKPYPQLMKEYIEKYPDVHSPDPDNLMAKNNYYELYTSITNSFDRYVKSENLIRQHLGSIKTHWNNYIGHPFIIQNTIIPSTFDKGDDKHSNRVRYVNSRVNKLEDLYGTAMAAIEADTADAIDF